MKITFFVEIWYKSIAPTDEIICLTLEQKSKLIEESLQPGFVRNKACEKHGISMACLSISLKNKETILKSADTFKKQGFKAKSSNDLYT